MQHIADYIIKVTKEHLLIRITKVAVQEMASKCPLALTLHFLAFADHGKLFPIKYRMGMNTTVNRN